MPGTAGPRLGLVWGYVPGESGWGVGGFNPNMARLEALVHLTVVSIANDPPGTPANGDCYVVGTSPTGVWVGHAEQVAVYYAAGGWMYITPATGVRAFNRASQTYWRYDGADWIQETVPTADVSGPASSTDNHIAVFSGTTGKLLKDGGEPLPDGFLVGTTDSQVLTNKIIEGANNSLNVRLGLDTTGSLPVTSLNGGIGANATTVWHGDGQWRVPAGGAGGGGASVTVSDLPPADPAVGDLWFDGDDTITLYVWLGAEWIPASNIPVGGGGEGLPVPVDIANGGTGTTSLPVDAGGSLGIPYTLLATTGSQVAPIADTNGSVGTINGPSLLFAGYEVGDSNIMYFRNRGTKAAPTALTADFLIGMQTYRGYYGSGWSNYQAQISIFADADWTPTNHATRIDFGTTAHGTTANVTRLSIRSGLVVGSATGGDMGAGTINLTAVPYVNGTSIFNNPVITGPLTANGGITSYNDISVVGDKIRLQGNSAILAFTNAESAPNGLAIWQNNTQLAFGHATAVGIPDSQWGTWGSTGFSVTGNITATSQIRGQSYVLDSATAAADTGFWNDGGTLEMGHFSDAQAPDAQWATLRNTGLNVNGTITANAGGANPGLLLNTQSGTDCVFNMSVSGSRSWSPHVSAVNGSYNIYDVTSGANRLQISSTGTCSASSTWGVISDTRLKEASSIQEYPRGLSEILALDPIAYQWNGKGGVPRDGEWHYGLAAQQVQEVMPELIREHEYVPPEKSDDEPMTLLTYSPTDLTFALINCIKSLQKQIDELKLGATP